MIPFDDRDSCVQKKSIIEESNHCVITGSMLLASQGSEKTCRSLGVSLLTDCRLKGHFLLWSKGLGLGSKAPTRLILAAMISNDIVFHVMEKGTPGGFCQRRIQTVELPIVNEGT